MSLLLFLSLHAKDAGLKILAIFIVAALLAFIMDGPVVMHINPSIGFMRSVLNGLLQDDIAAAKIFAFIIVYSVVAAAAVAGATRRALQAIDAGTVDKGIERIEGRYPAFYLFVLAVGIANGPLYFAGILARQWFIDPSLFGHLFAYLIYAALVFVSVGEITVIQKIRSRWKNRSAVA